MNKIQAYFLFIVSSLREMCSLTDDLSKSVFSLAQILSTIVISPLISLKCIYKCKKMLRDCVNRRCDVMNLNFDDHGPSSEILNYDSKNLVKQREDPSCEGMC